MKKIFAIFTMCIFAFAFTAVRAADTSPGHLKFSIEKTSLPAPAAFVSVNKQITEIPVFSFIRSGDKSANCQLSNINCQLNSNFLEIEKTSEVYHSPGWLVRKNFKNISINYRSKIFSPARIIPYSRDRS